MNLINGDLPVTNNTSNVQRKTKTRNKITYQPIPLPAEGFVRLVTILAVLQISKTSFLNGIKEGRYPPGKLLTPRTRVWDVKEVRSMLDAIKGEAE
jgi:prophage regulatory protein